MIYLLLRHSGSYCVLGSLQTQAGLWGLVNGGGEGNDTPDGCCEVYHPFTAHAQTSLDPAGSRGKPRLSDHGPSPDLPIASTPSLAPASCVYAPALLYPLWLIASIIMNISPQNPGSEPAWLSANSWTELSLSPTSGPVLAPAAAIHAWAELAIQRPGRWSNGRDSKKSQFVQYPSLKLSNSIKKAYDDTMVRRTLSQKSQCCHGDRPFGWEVSALV